MMKRRLFILATSVLILASLLGANFAFAKVDLPSITYDGVRYYAGDEIIPLRQENTKTFVMPNGNIGLDVYMGAIHYKDDYGNSYEQWKDIDTTIVNGRVDKAPYTLVIDYANYSIAVTSKRDGSVVTLGLDSLKKDGGKQLKKSGIIPITKDNKVTWKDIYTDTDIVIEAQSTQIKFKRVLKSNKAPADAEFNINWLYKGQDSDVICSGVDATGKEVKVKVTKTKDKLIEQVDTAGLVYPIEIDPTLNLLVGADNDDCERWAAASFAANETDSRAGAIAGANDKYGIGLRFTNVTIPQAATISTAYLTLKAKTAQAGNTCNTKISAEDADNVGDFAGDNAASFDIRFNNHTLARVDWNAIGAWVINTDYNSVEIKTVIKEMVDRGDWDSGDALVIFWEDFDDRSDDGASRQAWCRGNATPANCAKLHIEYLGPTVTTNAAESVEETSATLKGTTTAINDTNITERGFVWDTATHGDPGDVAPPGGYANSWTEVGVWGLVVFTHGITGLSEGELYFYRACVKNDLGTWGYGAEVTFITKPIHPTGFSSTAQANNVDIVLAWTNGASANPGIEIRRQSGSYPTLVTDGVLAYQGAASPQTDAGLTGGQTYYYRAWSWANEGGKTSYSDLYVEDNAFLPLVQQLFFQPNAIISGTTLPDRAAPAQDGTITWGVNPAGVTVYIGSLLVIPTGVPVGEVAIPEVAPPIAPPPGMFPGEEEMSGEALTWLHPTVDFLATTTNTPILMFWWFGCALFILMAMAATHKYAQNLLLTGFSAIIAIGACVGMAFLPAWFIIIAILMVSAMVVMERSPSM